MQFLRTVFWVVIAVLGVIFAFNNWIDVPVHLWGDIGTIWKLPFLLFAVFLLGLLPPWILHRVTRWSLRRKLETVSRNLNETRGLNDGAPVRQDGLPVITTTAGSTMGGTTTSSAVIDDTIPVTTHPTLL